jgi:hypothetical protein
LVCHSHHSIMMPFHSPFTGTHVLCFVTVFIAFPHETHHTIVFQQRMDSIGYTLPVPCPIMMGPFTHVEVFRGCRKWHVEHQLHSAMRTARLTCDWPVDGHSHMAQPLRPRHHWSCKHQRACPWQAQEPQCKHLWDQSTNSTVH